MNIEKEKHQKLLSNKYNNVLLRRKYVMKNIRNISNNLNMLSNGFKAQNINVIDDINHYKEKSEALELELESLNNQLDKNNQRHIDISYALTDKKVTDNTDVLLFLKEYNNIQTNWIKRILKIPKDYKEINSSDKARLQEIITKEYKEKGKDLLASVKATESNLDQNTEIIDFLNKKEGLKKEKENLSSINPEKIKIENVIKKHIEKAIDMDLKSLKNSFSEGEIDLKSILTYITELIKGYIDAPEMDKEKLVLLENNIKQVENSNHENKILNI